MSTKKRRYKTTSSKDKRSIVRALNTFSKQYDFILCNSQAIDLNIEPMVLSYSIDKNKYLDNIIYSKAEATINLQDTDLILDTIVDLLSINTKESIKDALKEIVQKRDEDGVNSFFRPNYEDLSIMDIESIVKNKIFAQRIYSQLKNRIMFYRAGIYSDNYTQASVQGKKIFTIPTNTINILARELEYVVDNLHIFDKERADNIYDLKERMKKEKAHPFFNQEDVPSENNSSTWHPIDEQEYNDPDTINKTAHMTPAMITRAEHGLYDEELHREYNKICDILDEDIEPVLQCIYDILIYEYDEDKVLKELYRQVKNDTYNIWEDIYEKHENFFLEINEYKIKFKNILREYSSQYKIDISILADKKSKLSYKETVELQDKLMHELGIKDAENLKYTELFILEKIYEDYGYGSSLEELIDICCFNRYSHPEYELPF